jgi:HK97 family phage prohead protease
MGAIPVHHTAVDKEGAWNAAANLKRLGDAPTEAALRAMHAWVDSAKDARTRSAYKEPHHDVTEAGEVGSANMKGVESALGRLNGGGLEIPEGDRKAVYAHLAAHYKDAGMDAPELKSRAAKHKSHLRMEIKQIAEDGTFEGLLSTYGNVDDGGDLVEAGAFTKTIKEHGNEVPLLWQHRPDVPIGMLTLEDTAEALNVKGRLLMDLPEARKAYLLIKARIVKGLSIGFDTVKDAVENGVRRLKELRLYEGSIVTFPMNAAALITSVKADAAGNNDFDEELNETQFTDAFYQMMSALRATLLRPLWSATSGDLTKEQAVEASRAIIEQFQETYMAYLPPYLDLIQKWYGTKGRPALETKEGRRHSAATKGQIQMACDHVKSAMKSANGANDILLALLEEEAVEDDTSESGAAAEGKSKSEPVNHSAISEQISQLKGAFKWN